MLKKLINKKIEAFKEAFPEYEISKNGNVYYKQGVQKVEKKVKTTGISVTKNTIDKLGTIKEWTEHRAQNVYLLTKQGKLMVRNSSNRFSNLSLKSAERAAFVSEKLIDIYLIGRKYEWIKDYPILLRYKFFKSFKSLGEAKNFLGFKFISDADFYSMFNGEYGKVCTLEVVLKAKDKSNAYKLLKNLDIHSNAMLKDYLHICDECGFETEIPAGKNKLKELHDAAIWEARKEDAKLYSKQEVYKGADCIFEEEWTKRGIEFQRLKTPYEMYVTGLKQMHCIGTNYYNSLQHYSFYTIYWKEKEYQIQLDTKGSILQFYGFNNSHPPQELRDLVKEGINLAHKIEKIADYDYREYPKAQSKKKSVDELLEGDNEYEW